MQGKTGRRRLGALGTIALACLPSWLQAAPPGWTAVPPSTLAAMRGGFTLADGLQLSLGLEQLLTLNGEVVARSQINLGHPAQALPGMTVFQNGSGNGMLSDFSPAAAGMVIQNTLNDQRIGSSTMINASVNSGALLDNINFHTQLSDALTRAVAPR